MAMWLLRSVDATDHTCVPYGEVCDQPSANGTTGEGGVVSDWSRGPLWKDSSFLTVASTHVVQDSMRV